MTLNRRQLNFIFQFFNSSIFGQWKMNCRRLVCFPSLGRRGIERISGTGGTGGNGGTGGTGGIGRIGRTMPSIDSNNTFCHSTVHP